MIKIIKSTAAVLLMGLTAIAVLAQAPTGIISGTVTDETSAVVPNAAITITSKATGVTRNVTANADGFFSAPGLPVGEYEVSAEVQGFRTLVRQAEVQAGGSINVPMQLTVGATREIVNVEAAAAQINYDSHSVQGVVQRDTIQDLPLNGRSFIALSTLEPGVTTTPGTTATFNSLFSVSILGGASGRTGVTVDGGSIQDQTTLLGTSINISQEVVQEFQLSSVNFDVSTGITGVGAINIVTRSGSNDFHGSALFFYRDHNMAAYPGLVRNPLNPSPFFARRNPGFWVGGPIIKDKLFFFVDYEYMNQAQATTVQPDLASVQGLAAIFTSPYRQTTVTGRFDYRLSSKHSVFVRYSDDRNSGFGQQSTTPTEPSAWLVNNNWSDSGMAGVTSTLTPNIVSEFRLQFSFWHNTNTAPDVSQCVYPCVGGGLPTIGTLVGSSNFQFGENVNAPQHRLPRRLEPAENVTWQKGDHRIKLGVDWQHIWTPNYWAYCNPVCTEAYSPESTRSQVPASALPLFNLPAKITSTADLLSLPVYNVAATGTQGLGFGSADAPGPYDTALERTQNKVHAYIGDTWKLQRSLTVNYGLGWVLDGGLFNTDLPRPTYLAPVLGSNNVGIGVQTNKRDFAPAVGFAWNIDKSGKTVIRGGAGIYWDTIPYYQKAMDQAAAGPAGDGRETVSANVLTNTLPGIVEILGGQAVPLPIGASIPLATITNMTLGQFLNIVNQQYSTVAAKLFPSAVPTSGPYSASGADIAKQASSILPAHFPLMKSYQTSIGVQRDLGHNMLLQVDYARRLFEHLELSAVDLNHYSEYTNGVRSPVLPICTAAQLYVPGQECGAGSITVLLPEGRDVYDGLLVKLNKRLSNRYQYIVSYALQKNVTNINEQNLNNWNADYGPNLARHNLNVAGIALLPWGFQLSVNSAIQSRTPVMATIGGIDLSGTNQGTAGPLPGLPFYNCLNAGCGKSQLAAAVASFNTTYAGTKTANGTTIPSLILPSDYQFGDPVFSQDFRLTKVFTYKERYKLTVLGEAFNSFNIANLAGYSFTLNTVNPNPAAQTFSFGKPTQRAVQTFGSGGPRALQVGARFTF